MSGRALTYLVTGAAGFIGFSVAQALLRKGVKVIGVDNHNDYYDQSLKRARVALLEKFDNYHHNIVDITDSPAMGNLFSTWEIEVVIHLAAQAGVRYSIENPSAYVESNLVGFNSVIDMAKQHSVGHFLYASSSSVYGSNSSSPFSESDVTDHPLSLYAATKKSNELVAHSYSSLFRLPTTGLRFFTVYGPWGRPDMALFRFTESIIRGEPITLYNNGEHKRDFTFVDDVVRAIIMIAESTTQLESSEESSRDGNRTNPPPFQIYNIGNGQPIELSQYVQSLEKALGLKAKISMAPMQPGDVRDTHADMTRMNKDFDFQTQVSVEEGVQLFVDWYRTFYD